MEHKFIFFQEYSYYLGQCSIFPDVFGNKETLGVNKGLRWVKKTEEQYQRIQADQVKKKPTNFLYFVACLYC